MCRPSAPGPRPTAPLLPARCQLARRWARTAALAMAAVGVVWGLAGCGGRAESAADGGGQAPTYVKAYTMDGGPLEALSTSEAVDGTQYVLAEQRRSPQEGPPTLVLARLDANGDVLWSRRPEGNLVGTLEEVALDQPGRRLTAPSGDGGAWIIGGGGLPGVEAFLPTVRRIHRLNADGAIVRTIELPANVALRAIGPANGGFVAAGSAALGRARHLWMLHVNAQGEVVSVGTAGSVDNDIDVLVHGVAFDPTGGILVSGQQMRLGALRPERGRDAVNPSALDGRFSAAFGTDGTLRYQTFEGRGLIVGPEVRRVDQGVWAASTRAGAAPDWIVTTRAMWTFQEAEHEEAPVISGLLRLDGATGQRRQAVVPPDSLGGTCVYHDVRLVRGGIGGSDTVEVLGVQPALARACLDRWIRDPASGELRWGGRTWLHAPEGSAAQAHQARWTPDGQVWLGVQRADDGRAVLHRFATLEPAVPQLSVPLPWTSPNEPGGYASNLVVLSDGEVMVSGGLVQPLASGQDTPLARLRTDGSVRWTLTRRDLVGFERDGALVQALPGGGAVVLAGRTWLRYAADGRLVSARLAGLDFDPGAVRGLTLLDRDGDGRDDDALMLALLAGPASVAVRSELRLAHLDADGAPLGDDQRITLGPDQAEAWVNELPRHLEMRRAGTRRLVAVTRHVAAPPEPGLARVAVAEHTVLWTDAAGRAGERLTMQLGGRTPCNTPMTLRSVATVPHEDGRLTLVSTHDSVRTNNELTSRCAWRRLWREVRVNELAADGGQLGENLYVAYGEDLTRRVEMPITAVGADRQPDGGLLLRMRWPGAVDELWKLDVDEVFVGMDYGDQGLVSLAPDGRPRWTRSYGGAKGEGPTGAEVWRGAQRDNGALSLSRSDSFGVRGAMFAVRTDADGRVDAACQAVRDSASAYEMASVGAPESPVVTGLRRGAAEVQRGAAFAGTVLTGFTDSAVTWEVARACSGSGQSPDLTVEVRGPGQVDSQPGGIACRPGLDSDCTQAYGSGSPVTLSATPDTGAGFVGWEGDCAAAGSGPAASLLMDRPRRCVARFQSSTAPPPPPPVGSCRADAPLAASWQDTAGANVPVAGLGYGVDAVLRGGLPLVAVSTSDSSTNTHRPWVAQWTGSTWSRLGSDADAPMPGFAHAPQIRANDSAVWLAWAYTDFSATDGAPPNRLEVRLHDGSSWRSLPRPVAQPSGTLTRWWLLLPADGAPVVAWMEPSRQRVQPLRWNGSAWDALEPLAVPQGGGLWALATDAAGTRLGAVWAGMPDTSTSLMRAWVRNPGGPGQPWVERSGGTLPGAGFGGFLSDLQLVLEGERFDAVLQRSDSSGRPPAGGPFIAGRQATASEAWAAFGDAGALLREPDFAVRPVGMQLLAGCGGAPWLAWRDDLNYPEARLWTAQASGTATPVWSGLGGQVVPQASVGSVMRVLSASSGDGIAWAVVVRATAGAAGSSVLRPELRLQRLVPAGP